MNRYEGKNIEEILEKIATEQGVNVADLGYFIREEKDGFLGIGKKVVADVYSYKDVEQFIKEYLATFFNNLSIEVNIDVNYDGKAYRIALNADNNAIIIGKGGQTLQSLNAVVRGATNAYFKKRFLIMIDINNYKADRYEKIKTMAYRIAKSVQDSKVSATLDPMPSDERRVIHNYLSKMDHVSTESHGEGKERRLIIKYKK